MPELENQGEGPKLNRGEKKCRKALLKIGMKQFDGVTRVTLRKRDGLIFVVNNPEVLRSDGDGKSFAAFGRLRLRSSLRTSSPPPRSSQRPKSQTRLPPTRPHSTRLTCPQATSTWSWITPHARV